MDGNGLLHYRGRKDHQVKVHGQRIELGEIEQCLFFISSISACVVMKWHDDYLIAYVQSSSVNEQQLRDHCQSHLPPHMIPSIFIILDRFPLNANGKIDRKSLPKPIWSSLILSSSNELNNPINQLEEHLLNVWCEILCCDKVQLSRMTNFFSIGGHSLLFLTSDQSDLCISCINANRYRNELQELIGMFVSTLPYRVQINPYWSFDEFVKHVQEKCVSIFEHSHYPLQRILTDFHTNESKVHFLETPFDFVTILSKMSELDFNEASLRIVPVQKSSIVAKFDFMLQFIYDPELSDGKLSCRLICSHDLFYETTATKLSQRFQYLFEQIFSSRSSVNGIDLNNLSLTKLTIILPEEAEEIEKITFCRQADVMHEEPISSTIPKARAIDLTWADSLGTSLRINHDGLPQFTGSQLVVRFYI
ncbi:hypothetical protein I4U23_031554 [Adineta vaga]|nr:hypothetical protein I4U23_031554 [Adineta vaga]